MFLLDGLGNLWILEQSVLMKLVIPNRPRRRTPRKLALRLKVKDGCELTHCQVYRQTVGG
jgi:hypothetical protein